MPAGTEPAISLELFVEAPDDESRRGEPVSCGLCWYACRGEHQSSISPRRVREWLE